MVHLVVLNQKMGVDPLHIAEPGILFGILHEDTRIGWAFAIVTIEVLLECGRHDFEDAEKYSRVESFLVV